MYKIFVIIKDSGSLAGGRAVTTETISYDDRTAAQRAYSNLIAAGMSGMTVIALF